MIAERQWALRVGLISKTLRFLAAILFVAFAVGAASAQTPSVNDAERATVRVAVIAEDNSGRMLYGTGSGFLVARNLVVTNAHVVAAARSQPTFSIAIVP